MSIAPKATADTIRLVESVLNYKFKNQELLVEALYISQQPAFIGSRVIQEANKQLGKVGQAAMNLAVVDKAYAAVKSTGNIEDWLQRICASNNLSSKGRAKGIAGYIAHEEGVDAITDAMMATAVKAILGAAFRDSGDIGVVRQVMLTLSLFDALSPLDR